MDISLIISTYNSGQTLEICLNSVRRLHYSDITLEVLIINDGSNDNTASVLDALELPDNFHVHTHQSNKGLAAARNTGIKNATGNILIFLDADMELPPSFVEEHWKIHRNSRVVGVLSAIIAPKNQPQTKYQRYLYESRRGTLNYDPAEPLPFKAFLFNCTSVKKSALAEAGLFDDRITRYGGEDTEFAYRLWQKHPQGLYYAPHIKVVHHHYRSFSDALSNVRIFGREVVPYLVRKHPEFDKLYGYSFICPVSGFRGFLKKIIGAVLKSGIVFTILKLFYHLVPYPVSNVFVRLLLASSLWQGISQSAKTDFSDRR